MSQVFVLNAEQRALAPIHPGYARRLLTHKKAAVFQRYPFTIILRRALPEVAPEPLRLKIDPGSTTTGLALVNDASGAVVWAAELTHRGEAIRKRVAERHIARRARRQRKTRYRASRFKNRRRSEDWLAPSLASRIGNIKTWFTRLCRLASIAAFSQEVVKFDTQLLENPEMSGIEYQQGTLAGYELRAYLLEKWGRQCAYCKGKDVPLQVEHLTPKARGGSDRVSNLTLACEPCNQRKGTQTAREFGYPELQAQAKLPLRDAAAVNATRWALFRCLKAIGLPVEVGTGGRTKWNRIVRNLPKSHWIDAACVGASTPPMLQVASVHPLRIRAMGRQRRQMCLMDTYGFPRTRAKGPRLVRGFQTGDLVRAVVPGTLKRAGTYVGRVAVKANGSFTITAAQGTVSDIPYRFCQKLHSNDGYHYNGGARLLSLP